MNAYFYLSFYNLSLLVVFWLLLSIQNRELQSLYSLGHFRLNNFYLIVLVISIFSIAGIPPFMGFFSKILVIVGIMQGQFLILYWLLTPLMLLTLYFYVQNIRFLYSIPLNSFTHPYLLNERVVLVFIYFTLFLLNLQVIGFMWFDKILLFYWWLLL